MINHELAKIFRNMAFYLVMENIAFKPQAYEKAAMSLEILSEDVEDIYKREGSAGLEKISGIGKSIAAHIVEYLESGKIKEYERLKKKTPVDLEELSGIEGLGPKKISILYKVLSIKNLKDLEKAAQGHKIAPLFGFGEKSEQNILEGIGFFKRSKSEFLLGEILPEIQAIIDDLKNLKEVKNISEAGSLRRRKETVGDADILIAATNAKKAIDHFLSLSKPRIMKVWGRGPTKVSVRTAGGFDIDIRIVPEKSFGAALQYFTGSKEHNIVLRKIAIEKGYKLNEYGLFGGSKMIAGEIEEEIYEKLGLKWIPPELRENRGEIEAALAKKLPKLIELKDIKGDLHCHSHWQNAEQCRLNADKRGINKGKEMINKYIEEAMAIGYEYIGISDHTKALGIEHGLDEKQLAEQRKEIDKLNLKFKIENCKLKILCGCEANIMANGSIDISDEALAKLDYVIAGVHSQMKMSKKEMTERIIKAMENPNVDIISHPFGRILKQRDEYEINFDKILASAKKTGTILEINANPYRLDLNDANIKKAKKAGVKMIINADSHQINQLRLMEYGVNQARRGWAEKKDIVNCWPVESLKSFFK